jgi:hypothetical protein
MSPALRAAVQQLSLTRGVSVRAARGRFVRGRLSPVVKLSVNMSLSFSAKEQLRIQMYEGDDKEMILEAGNGMGGGHNVRDGVAFLTAYARALHMSRRAFVHLLRNAPGTLDPEWREMMTPAELREIGDVEKENEGGAPSTSDATKAGEAGAADDVTTKKRAADSPADAPSGKATRVEVVPKGPVAEQREHTGAMDTATLHALQVRAAHGRHGPLAAHVERLLRNLSRLHGGSFSTVSRPPSA